MIYVLTFEGQWLSAGSIVRGKVSYPVSAPHGELDVIYAAWCCEIVASDGGMILLPDAGIDIHTVTDVATDEPIWEDDDVRVYALWHRGW